MNLTPYQLEAICWKMNLTPFPEGKPFMRPPFRVVAFAFACTGVLALSGCASNTLRSTAEPWTFAISGDSRNCGNIVMPAIAAGAKKDHAEFYWHLGDLRAIYMVDEDFAAEARFATPPTKEEYLPQAWPDFVEHQVVPFGSMPFFLGIGNHENIPPKTTAEFRQQFAALLDRPELRAQRAQDAARTPPIPASASDSTYYHWTERGVDFINLDNATGYAFDADQLAWFDAVLAADLADATVRSIVVGMHEALPYSKSDSHSMCSSAEGVRTGSLVYAKLVEAKKHKPVYVLASHSHYYLADIFNTAHWQNDPSHDAVLPGWIVGTAGAVRYALPPNTTQGSDAKENAYGYLIGTVGADGRIVFVFRNLSEDDLLRTSDGYAPTTVGTCWSGNSRVKAMQSKPADHTQCD